ncbi:hypothetical protein A4U53_029555 [Rhizobium ruizarguesonis]|uniref:Uncharacterized protein n=1 Tax=Rhizobium ruizarguesonis TaxID=2081791 RepID=A0ACD5ELZ0_9HYPH
MNSFITGLQVNPNPSNKVRETFDGIEFPPSLPASAILSNGLNLRLALDIGHFWRNVGLSDGAINDRAERLGKALTNDGPEIQIRRAIYGIASLGSTMVYSLGDSHREIFRGMTMAAMMDHQNYYYRWFGWISGENYQRYLDSFFGPTSDLPPFPFDSIAAAQIKRAWQPYLSSIPSSFLRDPVSLGSLPPDVWLASGFVAFLILIVRLPFVAMLFFPCGSRGFWCGVFVSCRRHSVCKRPNPFLLGCNLNCSGCINPAPGAASNRYSRLTALSGSVFAAPIWSCDLSSLGYRPLDWRLQMRSNLQIVRIGH